MRRIRKVLAGTRGAAVAGLLVLTTLVAVPATGLYAQQNGDDAVSEEIKLVQDLVAAFNAKDVDAIMELFGEDPVYHNMPTGPVKGAVGVRGLINAFVSPAETVDWEILNIGQSGNVVFAERIDRFVINGKDVALPCNGVFEIKDGKIAEWRDYFDMNTWQKQNAQ